MLCLNLLEPYGERKKRGRTKGEKQRDTDLMSRITLHLLCAFIKKVPYYTEFIWKKTPRFLTIILSLSPGDELPRNEKKKNPSFASFFFLFARLTFQENVRYKAQHFCRRL